MLHKRKVVEVPISIDFASVDQQRKWYLDIWGVQGSQFSKIGLFVASDMDATSFDDLGAMTTSCILVVDSHPNIECINIGVSRDHEYQLDPKAYVIEQMVRDKEDTMFTRGWKLDCPSHERTVENLQDSIAYCIKGKQKKEKTLSKPPNLKKAKGTTDTMDVDEVILQSTMEKTDTQTLTKVRFVDPKILKNEVQKALKSDTGGMEKYSKYFPFKYKEYETPVDQCWLALDHYNSRQIEPKRVDECVLFFCCKCK